MAKSNTARIYLVVDDKGFHVGMNKAATKLAAFGTKVRAIGDGMQSVGSTLTRNVTLPIVASLGLATKAAVDEEKEMALLSKALVANAGATDQQVAAVERWITVQQNATGIADGELRPALANLVRVTKDTGKAQDLLGTAMDISVAKGKSLETVSMAIAKAYAGNVGALGRLGIATKDAQGKTMSFEQVMARAVSTFGGSAATAAETTAGKLAILKARFADIAESIGNAVIPILEKLVPYIEKVAKWFENLSDGQRSFMVKAALVAAAVGPVVKVLGLLTSGVGRAVQVWQVLSRVLGGVGSAAAGATTKMTALGSSLRGIPGLISGIAVTVPLLATALQKIGQEGGWKQFTDFFTKQKFSDFISGSDEATKSFERLVNTIAEKSGEAWDRFERAANSAGAAVANVLNNIDKQAVKKRELTVDIKKAKASLDDIDTVLAYLHKQKSTPKVEADIKKWEEKRAEVEADIKTLEARRARIKAELDDKKMQKQYDLAMWRLDALEGYKLTKKTIEVALGNSAQSVLNFLNSLSTTTTKTINVAYNVGLGFGGRGAASGGAGTSVARPGEETAAVAETTTTAKQVAKMLAQIDKIVSLVRKSLIGTKSTKKRAKIKAAASAFAPVVELLGYVTEANDALNSIVEMEVPALTSATKTAVAKVVSSANSLAAIVTTEINKAYKQTWVKAKKNKKGEVTKEGYWKKTGKQTRMEQAAETAGPLSSLVTFIVDIQEALNTIVDNDLPTMDSEVKLKTNAFIRQAVTLAGYVSDAIRAAFTDTDALTEDAEASSAIGGILGDVSSVLSAFAALTDEGIDTAIVNIQGTRDRAPEIGAALKETVDALRLAFADVGDGLEDVTDDEGGTTLGLGSIVTKVTGVFTDIAGVLSSVLGLDSSDEEGGMTISAAIDAAIAGAKLIAGRAGDLGTALKTMLAAISTALGDISADSLTALKDAMESLPAISTSISDIVESLSELSAEKISAAAAAGEALGKGFLTGLKAWHDAIVAEATSINKDVLAALAGTGGSGAAADMARAIRVAVREECNAIFSGVAVSLAAT